MNNGGHFMDINSILPLLNLKTNGTSPNNNIGSLLSSMGGQNGNNMASLLGALNNSKQQPPTYNSDTEQPNNTIQSNNGNSTFEKAEVIKNFITRNNAHSSDNTSFSNPLPPKQNTTNNADEPMQNGNSFGSNQEMLLNMLSNKNPNGNNANNPMALINMLSSFNKNNIGTKQKIKPLGLKIVSGFIPNDILGKVVKYMQDN